MEDMFGHGRHVCLRTSWPRDKSDSQDKICYGVNLTKLDSLAMSDKLIMGDNLATGNMFCLPLGTSWPQDKSANP